jgi:hypothetical protein
MSNLIEFIQNHVLISGKIPSRRANTDWFIKYNYEKHLNEILEKTFFLNDITPTLPQRLWHICSNLLEKYKCNNPNCTNTPTFFSFTKGYLRTCSLSCAQHDPQTIKKITSTNLNKYGTKRPLALKSTRKKSENTWKIKYGVDNPTKSKQIMDKVKSTNLNKYGIDYVLRDVDKIKNAILNKYGKENVSNVLSIKKQASHTRKGNFYNTFISGSRLDGVIPLFKKEEYMGVGKDHLFLCKTCNNEFIGKIEDGGIPRCLNCYPKSKSVFEEEIYNFIINLIGSDQVLRNGRSVLNGLELDIYIPELKVAIECNGLYWHSEFNGGKKKSYHIQKTVMCEKQNIRLIHIFEDEWLNKQEIVKSKILHILNKSKSQIIFARNCTIKEIETKEKDIFLEKTHIQGKDVSKIKIGLFYKDSLISVMTFGAKRIFMNQTNLDSTEYELIRYSSSNRVIGGAGKLLKYFIKKYQPSKIISYADRRWTYYKNNLYERIGFTKVSDGMPNYWYFGKDGNYRRFHRFGFRKDTLSYRLQSFDPMLSEWENMKNNGWDRIWDCGNLKYEMILK